MYKCPVCTSDTELVGRVPFGKNCLGLESEDIGEIEYHKCKWCDTLFAPEIMAWPFEKVASDIYNDDYVKYDPDYVYSRAYNNYKNILNNILPCRHLDYGAGNGQLSNLLAKDGWFSYSFDPFSDNKDKLLSEHYGLITAFEVLEHVSDIHKVFRDFDKLLTLSPEALIWCSSLLDQDINSWYTSPRNGHILLHTTKGIRFLAQEYNMQYIDNGYQFGFTRK